MSENPRSTSDKDSRALPVAVAHATSWTSLFALGVSGCSVFTTSFDAYEGAPRSEADLAVLIGYPDWIAAENGRVVYQRRRDGGYLRAPGTIRLAPGKYAISLSYVTYSSFASQAYGDGIVVRGPTIFSVELMAGHTYAARRQECSDATPCQPISAVYFWIVDETLDTVVAGAPPAAS